jgi:hypothetical protein
MSRFYTHLSEKSYAIKFLWHLPAVVIHSSRGGEVQVLLRQASLPLLIVMFGR